LVSLRQELPGIPQTSAAVQLNFIPLDTFEEAQSLPADSLLLNRKISKIFPLVSLHAETDQ
jgi:hypothetical protein